MLWKYDSLSLTPRGCGCQVVGEPAVLVGNSLGGYAAMATAAAYPDLVRLAALGCLYWFLAPLLVWAGWL